MCDYLVDGETAADVVERCEEVLRWKPPGGEAAVALEEARRRERGEDVDADEKAKPERDARLVEGRRWWFERG